MTQIFAHRGASRLEPENTLAAFQRAVAEGADGIELDVRRTVDGALIVRHDPTLPDGRFISEIEADQLPDGVPTLASALDACTPIAVNVELKHERDLAGYDPSGSFEAAVAAVLAGRGPARRWLVSSFDHDTMVRALVAMPGVRTALLVEHHVERAIRVASDLGLDAVHPDDTQLSRAHVRAAHNLGLAVNVWTVDDVEAIDRLLGWGVDGIVTNDPASALARRETRA